MNNAARMRRGALCTEYMPVRGFFLLATEELDGHRR